MKKYILTIVGILSILNIYAQEQTSFLIESDSTKEYCLSSCCEGHLFSKAPMGVIADHMHNKKSLMFTYRSMFMGMNGNLSGSESVSEETIFSDYKVSPKDMMMQMNMLGVMYAPSDNITVMAMANYNSNVMSLETGMGKSFETKSAGFGDVKLSALIRLFSSKESGLISHVGLSLPTGGINEKDGTPMSKDMQLAYPMQLGSGTFDPFVGATFNWESGKSSVGTQVSYLFRLGENDNEYKMGDVFDASIWYSYSLLGNVGLTFRTNYRYTGSVESSISDEMPAMDMSMMNSKSMMPLFEVNNTGGSQLNLLGGVNYYILGGTFKGLKIAFEAGIPMYQYLNGIQMNQNYSATVGLQYSLEGN